MLMKTVAVIPAAGAGKRMGNETSKQYLSLGAVPIVVRTLRVFAASPSIDGIILVVPAGDVEEVRGAIVEGFGIGKVEKIVAGGRQRQDSVKAGIDALPGGTEVVVIHDGVRPLVTEGLIALCVDGARQFGAASLGVPLKDGDRALGYFCVEKAAGEKFSTEEEVIVAAVANQVGLGIVNALHRQEERNRQRLEQARMRRS